jgi:hypothetical protein
MSGANTQVPGEADTSSAATTPTTPEVDASEATEVDASAESDESEQQPTDDLQTARAERDAAKQARRDAEAERDSLAAKVAELESSQAELAELKQQTERLRSDGLQKALRESLPASTTDAAIALFVQGAKVDVNGENFEQSKAVASVVQFIEKTAPQLLSGWTKPKPPRHPMVSNGAPASDFVGQWDPDSPPPPRRGSVI